MPAPRTNGRFRKLIKHQPILSTLPALHVGVSETLARWVLEVGSRGGLSVMNWRRGFQRAALQKKIVKRS